MARQNIQFKGLRHAPSDITGQDGDLLECVNLVHQNGELKPLEMPERMQMKGVWDNETLVAVHNLTDGKKFVFAVWNGVVTTIHVKDESDPGSPIFTYGIPHEEIQWVETIGNTLIIGTDKSTHYALYKNGSYKWLGDKLPQPVFEFDFTRDNVRHDGMAQDANGYYLNEYDPKMYGLLHDGEIVPGGGLAVDANYAESTMPMLGHESRYLKLSNTTNENKKIFKDGIIARHAQVMSVANDANLFVYPFLVRYAVRMFDGNYAMHSAPIIMIPSSLDNPLLSLLSLYVEHYNHSGTYIDEVIIRKDDDDYFYCIAHESMQFRPMELVYTFRGFVDADGNMIADASDWEDIIKGVDLFLSSQIYSFDESAWKNINNVPTSFRICHENNNNTEYGHCYSKNQKIDWWDIYTDTLDNQGNPRTPIFNPLAKKNRLAYHDGNWTQVCGFYLNYRIPLPTLSKKQMIEKIKETNLFFRAKQYDLQELDNIKNLETRFSTEVEKGVLERLETLPTLPDDYVSRSRIVGNASYNYNQRLILGNINLQAPLWYQDAKTFNTQNYNVQIWFEIEKPEKTIRVYWNKANVGLKDFGHYLYYPDPDCKRAVIDTDAYHVVVPMSEHTGLHGAFALMPDLESLWEAASDGDLTPYTGMLPTASTPEQRYYSMQNTIAMSSVANPFHFPATNFKDIGRAKVIGIAANMLDVSSAQWGQYPIYVFCSDGIIAVMIDGEGKMGGIQAVSADVLREPRGLSQPTLVQTGQTLMFLTQRGVMAIAGTKISCVSEAMEGRHFNPMRDLADVDYHVGAFQNLIAKTSDNTSFVDFAASGFLAYDYAHNRVMLLRSDKEYQYLFNMKTGLWSKQIVYNNLSTLQMVEVPGTNPPADRGGDTYPTRVLKVKPISGAVNNYTEMYLQDMEGRLYQTMNVMGENNEKQLYQYGYFISRPIRFGTDEYKTIVRTLHRYTHYANNSFVRMAMYGSRDGVKYGRINTLRGMSYQYFIFAIYTYLKPNERYSYLSVDFETRLSNKLR